MAKKVPFYALWDFKSLPSILVVVTICLCFLFFPVIKDGINSLKIGKLDGHTEGNILSIKEQDYIHQSKEGNKFELAPYVIKYEYSVEDIVYENTETIDPMKWRNHLKEIKVDTTDFPFPVRYNTSSPSESLLKLRF